MAEEAGDAEAADALEAGGFGEDPSPVARGDAVARQSGLELEVHGDRIVHGYRGSGRLELVERRDADLDAVRGRGIEALPRFVQPGHDRSVDPLPAQLECFGDLGDAQTRRAPGERGDGC